VAEVEKCDGLDDCFYWIDGVFYVFVHELFFTARAFEELGVAEPCLSETVSYYVA